MTSNNAALGKIQRHLSRLLTHGVYGMTPPEESIVECKAWHISDLGVALTRTATLMQAVQVLLVLGFEVESTDITDVDCCYSMVPVSMAYGVGDEYNTFLVFCTMCQEQQN